MQLVAIKGGSCQVAEVSANTGKETQSPATGGPSWFQRIQVDPEETPVLTASTLPWLKFDWIQVDLF